MSTLRSKYNPKFWDVPDEEVYRVVNANMQAVLRRSSVRRQMDLYHACMYGDAEFTSVGDSWMSSEYSPSTLAFNVIRQTVDTLTAKISKCQPLPTPTTRNGTFAQKRRAKKLEQAFIGQFDASGVWKTSPSIARDTALFGTGITHNFRVGKTVHHERILPWELLVDAREAMYGTPRTIYLRRWIDRGVLKERFPEHAELIEAASGESQVQDIDPGYDVECDQVLVIEAWHLPSRTLEKNDKEKHDGFHTIVIESCTLFTEKWRKAYFPFSILKMSDPVRGFYGTGLAYQLTGLQYTINDTASVLQECHAMAGGYILVDSGSTLETDKLDNGRGRILFHNGSKPEWINPQPAHPDTMNFLMAMLPLANQMSGVSELSAQSQKPAGIESSIALERFNDFETERFALFAKQFEEYHIDIAWQMFDLWEEIHEEFDEWTVIASRYDRGSREIQDIDYDKVRLDRNGFSLQCFPTNYLSKKPTGQMAEIENMINMGWISREDALPLMQMPDNDAYYNLQNAARRVIEDIISKILDCEDVNDVDAFDPPEPEYNLKLCGVMGLLMYNQAKLDGCPAENLAMLSDWLLQVKQLQEPPQQLTAPPGMNIQTPEAPMPPGAGMPDPNADPSLVGQPAPPPVPGMGERTDLMPPEQMTPDMMPPDGPPGGPPPGAPPAM